MGCFYRALGTASGGTIAICAIVGHFGLVAEAFVIPFVGAVFTAMCIACGLLWGRA